MKRFLMLVMSVCIAGTTTLLAQCTGTCGSNLLPNPGFELYTSLCTTADIQLYANQSPVQNWFGTENYNPNQMAGSTPDYFSPCAGSTNSANNVCMTGNARLGMFTKTSFANGREYVQAQLTNTLTAGKTYCFSMVVKSKVGAAGNLLSSCDGIGAWFHNQGLINIATMNGGNQFIGPGSTINAAPQIENASGNLIGAACVTVTGTFCAQGGEQWIVLGNFRNDANTQISGSNPSNYMYIDDVSLFEICRDVQLSASADTITCGQSTVLSTSVTGFSATTTYTWTLPSGNTLNGSGPHTVTPLVSATYQVVVSEPGNCGIIVSDTASVFILVNGPCNVYTSVADTVLCSGACYNIKATVATGGIGPYTYSWTPNIGTGNGPFAVCPTTTILYKVTVSDAQGQTYTDSAIVTVNSTPLVNAGIDDSICAGAAATLNGTSSAGTLQWINGPATAQYQVSPAVTTTYILQAGNNGCTGKDTVTVNVFNPPQLSMNHTDVTCYGKQDGTATSTVTAGTSPYTWQWGPGSANTQNLNNLGAGTYTLLVTDKIGCKAMQQVSIIEPMALHTILTGKDTLCNGQQTSLYASVSGGTVPLTYQWSAPGTGNSLVVNPASTQTYQVVVTDNKGCRDTSKVEVLVYPVPVADFTGTFKGCARVQAGFTNTSTGANQYWWDFGDNSQAAVQHATHIYTAIGCMNVSLIATNSYGCSDTTSKACAVNVYPNPHAGIVAQNSTAEELSPEIYFSNTATGETSCTVAFGDGVYSSACLAYFSHIYPSSGSYTVMQIVSTSYGCADTACIKVEVVPEAALWVPGAFTPGTDHLNDVFIALGVNIKEFEMYVFDRWGQQLFYSDDVNKGWDGNLKGKAVQEDTYVWILNYSDINNKHKSLKGTVALIR